MSLAAGFVLNQELSRVVFYPPYMDHFVGHFLKEQRKGNGRPWNQMGSRNSAGHRLC